MRLLLSTLLLATLPSWSYSSSTPKNHNISLSNKQGFNKWLKQHNKSYRHPSVEVVTDSYNDTPSTEGKQHDAEVDEYERRLDIFVTNSKKVERHNEAFQKGYTSYAMTVSESPFADLTNEEFRSVYLMEEQNCSATHKSAAMSSVSASLLENSGPLPKSIDWRTKGVLTPIKNQKQCGSCWTFSTTGTLEAHTCIHDATLDCTNWSGLAEQQLLDCSSAYDNHGCNGGLPSHAFEYIKERGGLDTERNYPYSATDGGPCVATESEFGVAEVYNITSRDEDDLANAIANVGPVSVAFDVASDFKLYSHGVYDSFDAETNSTVCTSDAMSVNHAVVAVGFGETDGEDSLPYYIVRNSWSNTWGMEGYFWIKRGENLCGISDCASFPIVPALDRKMRDKMDGDVVTATLRKRAI
mmetsp:Transcript_14342/g.16989  ORF Transcript_14342/g.16989 Transcript_14342/m.16989 type:complete len:412 (+) Transcript_14342:71-1306(+)